MRWITTSRVLLIGALALGALGVISGLSPCVTTAEAAASVRQFAGTYVGPDPEERGESLWTVTISDGGRVAGVPFNAISGDKLSGNVGADGSYSVTVSVTIPVFVRPRGRVPSEPELEWRTIHYKASGNLAPDGYGNLVGTEDTGGSFVWVRQ